jgi:S1-C subfamily serine protease
MRKITSLRGKVRSGNSGGPVVDSRGRVLATIFAASLGRGERTGFGVPDSIVVSALRQARGAVGTGPCAH